MRRLYTIVIGFALLLAISLNAVAEVGNGVPFFRNFSAKEYHANNRNFDVECDHKGNVFVANFEGLLYYNGVDWRVWHSRGNSRITRLYKSNDGYIWFGGYDVFGRVRDEAGKIVVDTISDEKTEDVRFGVVRNIVQYKGTIYFTDDLGVSYCVKNHHVQTSGKLPAVLKAKLSQADSENETVHLPVSNLIAKATSGKGLEFCNADGQVLYRLNTDNGLCSNMIMSMAADDRGTLWGTTTNGIFAVMASRIYSYYSEAEGLVGQVTTILKTEDHLIAGTLQGVFSLHGDRFDRMSEAGSGETCWQLARMPDGTIVVALAFGLYTSKNGVIHELSTNHTLSVYIEKDGSILAGELDGIRRYFTDGRKSETVQRITNVSRLEDDGHGGVWAISLDKNTYHRKAGQRLFVKEKSKNVSILWDYRDDKGLLWHSNPNGKGLTSDGLPEKVARWLRPLNNSTVTTMVISEGKAWIGGTFGLIRIDLDYCQKAKMPNPKAYIRNFRRQGSSFYLDAAIDEMNPTGTITLYSACLHKGEKFATGREDQTFEFPEMPAGDYQVRIKAVDPYGNVCISDPIEFSIPSPIYLRWYAWVLYIIGLTVVVMGVIKWRLVRSERERNRLEEIVNERTSELRNAQKKLIRQEKEASIGKLTKGLIDRILNPLNYINNFSHLTLGLTKDLKDDIEEIRDTMEDAEDMEKAKGEAQDAIEDVEDVMQMMQQNLDKIEQHGVATTRILKAMEEMLKERGGKVEPQDVAMLCQQDVDMLRKYCEKDIQEIGAVIEWQKPEYPIVADVVADELSKVIMSMLNNSLYAVKRKWQKGLGKDYIPTVRLDIVPPTGEEPPTIKIWDNGTGIEESILTKIFDPFFTTKPTGDATGVGLYLSRQIVEDIGGRIIVESVKNEWTEFKIILP